VLQSLVTADVGVPVQQKPKGKILIYISTVDKFPVKDKTKTRQKACLENYLATAYVQHRELHECFVLQHMTFYSLLCGWL